VLGYCPADLEQRAAERPIRTVSRLPARQMRETARHGCGNGGLPSLPVMVTICVGDSCRLTAAPLSAARVRGRDGMIRPWSGEIAG
jgi:hypothetical protein